MGVKHSAVEILSTWTSKASTAPIPTFMLTSGQMSLKVFSDIGDITILIGTVWTRVPFVSSIEPTCSR